MFAHVKSVVDGLSTVRAFNAGDTLFEETFCKLQDVNTSASFIYLSSKTAFALWIDLLIAFYLSSVMFTLAAFSDMSSRVGSIGLAIMMTKKLTSVCKWGIKKTAKLEIQMISVERVLEYCNLPSEVNENGKTFDDWPNEGNISFKKVNLRYNNEDPNVLTNFNLSVDSNEKLGIVGRSGSGKSSIVKLLVGLVEPTSGSIKIDDKLIQEVNLRDLRTKITYMPQTPNLFHGTIRKNLDPHEKFNDAQIWDVLEAVNMKTVVQQFSSRLDSDISDAEKILSAGQKQLLCFVRALIERNKIIVLDEVTAGVDER